MLIDTSGLLAALFPDQRHHEAAANVMLKAKGPFILSPFVLAELDYLILKLAGVSAEIELLEEVARGAYQLESFERSDIHNAQEVIKRHGRLGIGLADASIVVLSRRFGTRDVLTLDQRHFRVLRGPAGKPFRLLPDDR